MEITPGAVIVAVPSDTDPIHAASSEDLAHMTLIWLGKTEDLTPEQVAGIDSFLKGFAQDLSGEITESVSGHATLGAEGAQVLLLDASAFAHIRNGLLEMSDTPDAAGPIRQVYESVEQFPTWMPHITLGYPDKPAASDFGGDSITFDRLEFWNGADHMVYPFAGSKSNDLPKDVPISEQEGEDAVAAEFTTQISDALERPLDSAEQDLPNLAEDEEGEDDLDDWVEIPFHGIAAPTETMSGDKRLLKREGARFRNFPFPLFYQRESEAAHGKSVRVGRIDEMWVDEEGMIRYKGYFNSTPEVDEVITGIVDGSIGGVSIDVDEHVIEKPELAPDATVEDMLTAVMGQSTAIFTDYRIAGLTTVGIPAFQEVYIALGEEDCTECEEKDDYDEGEPVDPEVVDELVASVETFAPGTKDGPGWLTHPVPTGRIRRYWTHGKGAAKIKWGAGGDFNRCRRQLAKYITNPDWLAGACANMHKEALGIWPATHAGKGKSKRALLASAAEPAPAVSLVASGGEVLPAAWFMDPKLKEATPITITEDGRIFGHLATWGTCHIGFPNECTTPPFSASGYAYFRTGAVDTDQGEMAVGQITMGTGHAGPRADPRRTLAHYDNTGSAVADVAAGEDSIGIWVAGAVRSNLTAEKLRELKAAALSGDWRKVRGNFELMAALAVNVPGFPIPRTRLVASGAGEVVSLIASGLVLPEGETFGTSDEDLHGLVRAVADEVESRQARREKLAALQPKMEAIRSVRVQRVRERTAGLNKETP